MKIQGLTVLALGFGIMISGSACFVDDADLEEEAVGEVQQAQSGHCGGVCWVCDDVAIVQDSNGSSCKADFDHLDCTVVGAADGCSDGGYACVYRIRGEEGTTCQANELAIGQYTCTTCKDAGGSIALTSSSSTYGSTTSTGGYGGTGGTGGVGGTGGDGASW